MSYDQQADVGQSCLANRRCTSGIDQDLWQSAVELLMWLHMILIVICLQWPLGFGLWATSYTCCDQFCMIDLVECFQGINHTSINLLPLIEPFAADYVGELTNEFHQSSLTVSFCSQRVVAFWVYLGSYSCWWVLEVCYWYRGCSLVVDSGPPFWILRIQLQLSSCWGSALCSASRDPWDTEAKEVAVSVKALTMNILGPHGLLSLFWHLRWIIPSLACLLFWFGIGYLSMIVPRIPN